MRDPDQFIFCATELVGEPNIFRSFLEHLSQEFAPDSERLFLQILAFQEEQVEHVID